MRFNEKESYSEVVNEILNNVPLFNDIMADGDWIESTLGNHLPDDCLIEIETRYGMDGTYLDINIMPTDTEYTFHYSH